MEKHNQVVESKVTMRMLTVFLLELKKIKICESLRKKWNILNVLFVNDYFSSEILKRFKP